MTTNRYVVRPCDNLGLVTPKPPRDRTWVVVDTTADTVVDSAYTRAEARTRAALMNAEAKIEDGR